MITLINSFEFADNLHTIYFAAKAGDELPPGLHRHEFEHICVPMAGEIEAFFNDRESIKAKPGDPPFEFASGRWHGIRSKSDGAIFMNVARISRL